MGAGLQFLWYSDEGEMMYCSVDLLPTFMIKPIGGAHQQTSERAVPPVSVEEKGKTTGEKRKLLLFLLMSIQN
jgi:hypothetical protein